MAVGKCAMEGVGWLKEEAKIEQALVTGAAGFTGANLVERLLEEEIKVFAVVRHGSPHNGRISGMPGCCLVECDAGDYDALLEKVKGSGWNLDAQSICFHLLNAGNRSVREQMKNISYTVEIVEISHDLGCYRFVATGSQAEYGIVPPEQLTVETLPSRPITAYGISKVAACDLSRLRAKELGMEWIWGRIFSLIGRYEPPGRMLPDLYHGLETEKEVYLTSCSQSWDYLDVRDAASALLALGRKGRDGEIYNIAHGAYRSLKEYTEELRREFFPNGRIHYGDDPNPYISLQPSVEKIRMDTGWVPVLGFRDSVQCYLKYILG